MSDPTLSPDALALAARAIDDLAARPAATFDEVLRRLAHVSTAALRRVLADAVCAPAPDGHAEGNEDAEGDLPRGALAVLLLQHFKCGAERDRIAAVVLDERRPRERRKVAYQCVQLEGAYFSALLEALPEEDRLLPMEDLIEKFLGMRDEAMADEYADLLAQLPPHVRAGFHRRADRMRRERGVPAATFYARTIAARGIPPTSRDAMLAAIEEEADESGLAMLEAAVRRMSGPPEKALRASLRRLREKLKTRPAAPVTGRAALTACAGDGRVVLLAELERLGGCETSTFIIDAERGLSETQFERRAAGKFDEEQGDWTAKGLVFAPVSLGHAAALVAEAVEARLVLGRAVSPGARGGIESVSRVPAEPLPAPVAAGDEGEATLAARLAAMFRAPVFAEWYLEPYELARAGVDAPVGDEEPWVLAAAPKIAAAAPGKRLARMARLTARWYALAGRPDEAATLAAAAQGEGLVALCTGVARATFARHRAGLPQRRGRTASELYGEPAIRQRLRELLRVSGNATGADLARLDFAEITRILITLSLRDIPPDRWPTEAEIVAAAVQKAKHAVERLRKGEELRRDPRHLDTSLPGVGFERIERWELVQLNALVEDGFTVFVDTTCRNCAVKCIEALGEDRTEAYFAEEHPAS